MKTFRILCLLFTFLSFSPSLIAQTEIERAKQIIDKLNQPNYTEKSFECTMTEKFYSFYTDKQPKEVFTGYIKRNGMQYRSNTLGVLTIQNKDAKLIVDTGSHTIVYTNPTPMQAYNPENLTSMLALCSKVQVLHNDSIDRITLEFSTNEIPLEMFEITIQNSQIKKLVLYHNATTDENDQVIKPKTEILFNDIVLGKSISSKEFEVGSYISVKNGKINLTEPYQNYTLSNLFVSK